MLREIEPDAAASHGDTFVMALPLVKLFEYFFSFPRFNTDSIIPEVYQDRTLTLLEGNIDPRFSGIVVFNGIGQEIHEQHLKQRDDDRMEERFAGRVFHMDFTITEDVMAAVQELPNQGRQVNRREFSFVNLALDPGEVQDAVNGAESLSTSWSMKLIYLS